MCWTRGPPRNPLTILYFRIGRRGLLHAHLVRKPPLTMDCNMQQSLSCLVLVRWWVGCLFIDSRSDCNRRIESATTKHQMKIFNWIGFMAVATSVAHLIFAGDSSVVNTTSVPSPTEPVKPSETGRMSKIWERQVSPPYAYNVNYRPQLASAVQPSKYPGESNRN